MMKKVLFLTILAVLAALPATAGPAGVRPDQPRLVPAGEAGDGPVAAAAPLDFLSLEKDGLPAPTLVADPVVKAVLEMCTAVPIDWELVRDLGSYLIEFCWKTPGVKGVAYGDFHRRGGGSGSLGGYLSTEEFWCNIPADKAAMTDKARKLFCP